MYLNAMGPKILILGSVPIPRMGNNFQERMHYVREQWDGHLSSDWVFVPILDQIL